MSKPSVWDEVRFFVIGETMGLHYRDQMDMPISKEMAEKAAHQAAPSLEAFSFPKYREAFITGFLRVSRII